MRFPLRLTAKLAKALLARRSQVAPGGRPVQFVDAAEILHHDSSHPVSHEKIREVIASRAPAVWIGGSEPLLHPGVAHLVRAIAQTGHFVFLETDGTLLRRRIHEFQPVSRLFLTVRLEPGAHRRAAKGLQANAWDLATEGIRAARLSGFLICAHGRIHEQTELREVAEFIQVVRSLDVDGIVISAANAELNPANQNGAALSRKTAEARKLIGSIWWEYFSRLVEPFVSEEPRAARNAAESSVRLEQESRADEEGVRIA
jgi:molybdenum cofactor biosynthesis enzyme MoaA